MARTLTSERINVLSAIHVGVRLGLEANLRSTMRQTTSANTANVADARANWIESVVGLFDNYPGYSRVIENMRANRQRLDEQFIAPE